MARARSFSPSALASFSPAVFFASASTLSRISASGGTVGSFRSNGTQHVDRVVGLDQVADLVLVEAERLVGERLHVADVRDLGAGGERRRLFDLALADGLLQGLAADDVPAIAVGLLAGEVEARSAVSSFSICSRAASNGRGPPGLCSSTLMMWKPNGRLDDVAHLARLEREGRRIERRHHAAAREETEVAALGGGAGILRVLLGELLEVAARLRPA